MDSRGSVGFQGSLHQAVNRTLRWILSTGLPLHTNFEIWLNGNRVQSSKENLDEIKAFKLGSSDDTAAAALKLPISDSGSINLSGIGEVTGTAQIYKRELTKGKSSDVGRSNGFFVRVRGRVINLDDELFGIEALNHAAWSRFAMEIDADGLRAHLLSSREGVRDSEDIRRFRDYLRSVFNSCRSAYESWNQKQNEELDIAKLLSDTPSAYVTDPLFNTVRSTIESGLESFYISVPRDVPEDSRFDWLDSYQDKLSKRPFDKTTFEQNGPNAPVVRYVPDTRNLAVNTDHPFVDKITSGNTRKDSAKLFASSEVLLEGQLQDQAVDLSVINSFMRDRDRVLRLMAGDAHPTAAEVLRRLEAAKQDHTALERAVGAVFQVLGFKYERKGGNAPGADGVLYARLGRNKKELANYSLVYDSKQTNQPSVPANKIDVGSLDAFRDHEKADFGFFIAETYADEEKPDSTVNRKIASASGKRLTLLKLEHLQRLVWLHYRHGVTLTELRSLFDVARTVSQANEWIDKLQANLGQDQVPLRILLEGLEKEKRDPKATPNVIAVRAKNALLQQFEPERLIARLEAVETIIGQRWLEVDHNSGDVIMHQTADQIIAKLDQNINDLGGEDSDIS